MDTLKEIKSKIDQNKEEKKNKLLKSAYTLFQEKGFNNTSINDIVKKSNVAKGTFYLYFKNKDEIRNQLVSEKSQHLFDNALKKMKNKTFQTFYDKLIFIIDNVIEELNENNDILILINRDLSLAFYSKEFSRIFSDNALGLYELFKLGIEEENLPIENIDITFFMIVELVGTTCYHCMIHNMPCNIETYKPHLYKAIKALIYA